MWVRDKTRLSHGLVSQLRTLVSGKELFLLGGDYGRMVRWEAQACSGSWAQLPEPRSAVSHCTNKGGTSQPQVRVKIGFRGPKGRKGKKRGKQRL